MHLWTNCKCLLESHNLFCPLPLPVSITGIFCCIWLIILQQHSKEQTQDQTSALESCYLMAHNTVSDSAAHVSAPRPSWVDDSTFHTSQVGILLWFPLKVTIIFTIRKWFEPRSNICTLIEKDHLGDWSPEKDCSL